jgi:type IV secretory pathway VirB2 component (pilin)
MKLSLKNSQITSFAWALIAAYALILIPADALANVAITLGGGGGGGGGALADTLCKVVKMVTGGIGGAIATLAIIVIGIGALMGKVSWGMAIIVGLGVGIVFGADQLVTMLGGKNVCPN